MRDCGCCRVLKVVISLPFVAGGGGRVVAWRRWWQRCCGRGGGAAAVIEQRLLLVVVLLRASPYALANKTRRAMPQLPQPQSLSEAARRTALAPLSSLSGLAGLDRSPAREFMVSPEETASMKLT
jgi:hypothetical protein